MLFEKISTLCEKRNITIAKLERECAMGNGTVRGWKNSSPSIENLKKVADYFGITVDELISEETGDDTPRVHLTVQKITDVLYINTGFRQKKVEIIRNGTRTDAFDYIDLSSRFFSLQVGDNVIEYASENGLAPQNVEIYYKNRYLGV